MLVSRVSPETSQNLAHSDPADPNRDPELALRKRVSYYFIIHAVQHH